MSVLDVMQEVLEHARESITPEVEAVIVQPGLEVAWDSECGMLWVRLAEVQPVYVGGMGCPVGVNLTLGVGLYRCVATIDAAGRPPTPKQISDDGAQMAADVQALYEALGDWKPEAADTARLGQWVPSGPMGAAAGGEWLFHVRSVV